MLCCVDLGITKDLIKVAKEAGCDAVKFQKRTIDIVYNKDELNKPRISPWGKKQSDQKKGLEFGKKQYKEIAKFSTWLYTIAKNLANTELRKRKNRKITLLSHFSNDDKTYEIPSDDLEIGQQVQTDVVNEIIKNAVNQLSEKFKTVIILRDIQEISYEQISEIIGIPIGTVKSRINRARLQLQVELKYLRE